MYSIVLTNMKVDQVNEDYWQNEVININFLQKQYDTKILLTVITQNSDVRFDRILRIKFCLACSLQLAWFELKQGNWILGFVLLWINTQVMFIPSVCVKENLIAKYVCVKAK